MERIALTDGAIQMAEKYIAAGAIGAAHRIDARHIALATVNDVDVLVSWNFRHIVNVWRIRTYNAVNVALGYRALEIRTPREVVNHG